MEVVNLLYIDRMGSGRGTLDISDLLQRPRRRPWANKRHRHSLRTVAGQGLTADFSQTSVRFGGIER